MAQAVFHVGLHYVQDCKAVEMGLSCSRSTRSSRHMAESYFCNGLFTRLQVLPFTSATFNRQGEFVHELGDSFRRKSGKDTIPQLELESHSSPSARKKSVTAVYLILMLNLGIFVADHLLKISDVRALYLYHNWPRWYQFFTATFCHVNWNHLSSNLFFLYIFGKSIEEEEGGLALWIFYLITGAGANLVSWLILPRTVVSVGASGAVFGLFVITVLVKISWSWRKILEVLILGQFVMQKVLEAAQASALMTTNLSAFSNTNHIAHLSGALIGAAFIWLVSRIPSGKQNLQQKRLWKKT